MQHARLVPVNTDNGWRAWPVRIGGRYGGSCDGSVPFETEDGGEIIDAIPIAAIERKWLAIFRLSIRETRKL